MNYRNCDIAIIGGGAAGLTAAAACAEKGAAVLVIDREETPGGVLLQCIHNGFGLHYFKEELTGPEYAAKVLEAARNAGAEIRRNATVTELRDRKDCKELIVYSRTDGVTLVTAKAVILAMGCRERNRGNLGIPGERLAGIWNAGLAQRLLNMEGCLPGKSAVIVGSGDIGLIMARRLSWCGIPVKAVVEIQPHPSGLSRNIAQCLEDFQIPLYLETAVTGIFGRGRVEEIRIAPLKEGVPDPARERSIACDTVLFSVGLIPENELSKQCGVPLHPVTGGAVVDSRFMTNVPGIFACGNVLHVHDLVDFVSEEASRCACAAVDYLRGKQENRQELLLTAGNRLRYVIPSRCRSGEEVLLRMRPTSVSAKADLVVRSGDRECLRKTLHWIKPAEMISVTLPESVTASAAPDKPLRIELEEKI